MRFLSFILLLSLIVSTAGCGQEAKRKNLERIRREMEEQGKRMAEMRKTLDEQRRKIEAASFEYDGTIDTRKELNRWLAETLRYPDEAMENAIEGKVWLKFKVDKDGQAKEVRVLRSSMHRILDDEALRVVNHLPPFGGEMLEQVTKDSVFMLPVRFKLE